MTSAPAKKRLHRKLVADLPSRWIVLKGLLFGVLVLMSALGLILRDPHWQTLLLVGVLGWACARGYYFLFYVIERYLDPAYRFAGVGSALRFLWQNRKQLAKAPSQDKGSST